MNNMETENSACPVRDYRRVEIMRSITATRAVRFGPGTGVKRACPMPQKPSAKSLNPYKSVIQIIYDNVNTQPENYPFASNTVKRFLPLNLTGI